jgi:hypothetical protein
MMIFAPYNYVRVLKANRSDRYRAFAVAKSLNINIEHGTAAHSFIDSYPHLHYDGCGISSNCAPENDVRYKNVSIDSFISILRGGKSDDEDDLLLTI